MSDDYWKKGREITSRDLGKEEKSKADTMRKSRLCDFISDPHQKIYYVFDFSVMWSFRMELIKIVVNEETGINYPRCIKVTGDAPKQYGVTNLGAVPEPEDFDAAAALDMEEELPEGVEGELPVAAADDDEEGETVDLDASDDDADDDAIPGKEEF